MANTVEQAITQAVGMAAQLRETDYEAQMRVAEAASKEVRTLVTGQLARLLDMTATAVEWNDAIEAAMQMVEDLS